MDNQQRPHDIDSNATRSAILRKEFGHAWEIWLWVRHQFTPSSLVVICSIAGVAITYVNRLQSHVIVLETQVVPLLKQDDKVLEVLSKVGVVAQRLTDIDARLERLEVTRDPRWLNALEDRVRRLEIQHDQEVMEARRPTQQLRRYHK